MRRNDNNFFLQVIGQRLEEFINEDKNLEAQILAMVGDEQKQKELIVQDEEEDFLDEGKFGISLEQRNIAIKNI